MCNKWQIILCKYNVNIHTILVNSFIKERIIKSQGKLGTFILSIEGSSISTGKRLSAINIIFISKIKYNVFSFCCYDLVLYVDDFLYLYIQHTTIYYSIKRYTFSVKVGIVLMRFKIYLTK